jgi:hypothetical protein
MNVNLFAFNMTCFADDEGVISHVSALLNQVRTFPHHGYRDAYHDGTLLDISLDMG